MQERRYLGLDVGERRIGVALSDASGRLATPLMTIGARDRPLERIARLAGEHQVAEVVVGLPLTLRGEEGPQAREARAFAERLARRVRVPVELHDERLTTRQALRAGGRADLDSRAAAHLLEGWLASSGARA